MKDVPVNFGNSKSKVDKIDSDKILLVPVHLSKLSNLVKMMLLKMMYIVLSLKIKIMKIK